MAQSSKSLFLSLALITVLCSSTSGQAPKFYSDDPIQAMPAPLPVKKPVSRNINEVADLLERSRMAAPRAAKPAGAVNTLGEVPASEWFITRHGRRRMSRDELMRGPGPVDPPAPPFTVTGGKTTGVSSGFRMKDSKGRGYFVKVDPLKYPELVTAADVIGSKVMYALGYNTPENQIVTLSLTDLRLSDKATITPSGERPRKMTWTDVEGIVRDVPHYPDGSFRIMASLSIEGEIIGPSRYEGTRPDDPNDIVPHEDRRDLRGLYVFSAWLNNTDTKPTNTLDTVVTENGVRFIRHYQLDFGNALGSDGDAPKDPRLGHEFLFPTPIAALEQTLTLGLRPASWELAHFPKMPAVGNFDSQSFDPARWKPSYPNPAFLNCLPDDEYWAAKQVMAFSDDDIRAIVETARYSDPRAADYVVATLAHRRDAIGRAFFSAILPLDYFRVESGQLVFDDLAVRYGFHAPRSYELHWSRFDNIRRAHESVSGASSNRLPPEALQAASGSYFSAAIDVPGNRLKPVSVYIRKEADGYKVVGIDRSW